MSKKLDTVMEGIGMSVFEMYQEKTPKDIKKLLMLIPEAYTVVTWPEVQDLMEENWFSKEAILDVESKFGDSAYLIPIKRIL
jgi:hypothetical protein